ncbi:MAG: OmpH family outer membrane protein [Pseudomonadales bacterium]|jgi:Skp family chaperone for outer membrane proteins|nr:OmpH family outer membrane protein [Pseudomonadales bacterium]
MTSVRLVLSAVGIASLVLLAGCEPRSGDRAALAIIDLDAVARALGRDDVIAQQINQANQQLAGELGQVATNLQQQVQARRDAFEVIGDEAEQELQQLTAAANQRLQQTQQLAQQRSAQFRQAVINSFRSEVTPYAQQIASERGAVAVLTVATPMLWFDSDADITDEVIAEMRRAGLEQASRPATMSTSEPASSAPQGEGEGDG